MPDSSIENRQKLLNAIKRGGKSRERALSQLYQSLDLAGIIRTKITRNSKTETLHLDVMHDAFYTFLEKVKKGEYDAENSIRRFILSASKYHYLNKIKKEKREIKTDTQELSNIDHELVQSVEEAHLREERVALMDESLNKMKTSVCKNILLMWMNKYSFKEIANKHNLKNESNARKRKYRCYKELLEIVRNQPSLKNYSYE